MITTEYADSLHRLVKQALDSGAAASIAEAEALFRGYRLAFTIDADEAGDPLQHAALLTGVALARRVFLGGVSVSGPVDVPLLAPLPLGATLGDAVSATGGVLAPPAPGVPQVSIGGGARPTGEEFHIRTAFAGWRGGIVPANRVIVPVAGPDMPLAPMLAAALAVNEAFLHVARETRTAGRRAVGLSLWQPHPSTNWLSGGDEPNLAYLPSRLWLIGLGHLGQAYLWGLGLMPYPDPAALSLMLQDVDVLTPSSESTSILTDGAVLGQKKTRAIAAWAERRGFATSICERLFDGGFRRQDSEPAVALCGLDNALGRRALDQVGFDFVVEAGLGRGFRDFRSIRLHTLPGSRSAVEIWAGSQAGEDVAQRAAYQRLLADGVLDRCGVTVLAGKAVGAPFVGAVAACLALSEILRLLHGGPLHHVIELDLQSVEHRLAALRGADLHDFNPGYVLAGPCRAVGLADRRQPVLPPMTADGHVPNVATAPALQV